MSAHTPGPWSWQQGFRVEGNAVGRQFEGIDGPGDEYVLEYADCGSHEVWVDNPADARLIAAAPELLEALRELLAFVDGSIDDLDAMEQQRNPEFSFSFSDALSLTQARAAIAKATGES